MGKQLNPNMLRDACYNGQHSTVSDFFLKGIHLAISVNMTICWTDTHCAETVLVTQVQGGL